MDRRTADATEQWLHSLLQSLEASPVPPLPLAPFATITTANTQQKKSSHANSTHEIRLGVDRRLVTLTFAVKDATAPVPRPQQKRPMEWPAWIHVALFVLACIVGPVVIMLIVIVYCMWLVNAVFTVIEWLERWVKLL